MYILPCVLALLSLMPAAPLSAAEPGLKVLVGMWRGSVTTEPPACAWKISAHITEKLGFARGGFTSSGPCGKGVKAGTFSARPTEPGCYAIDAGIPGLPRQQLSACFNPAGDLVFNSMLFTGKLTFSEDGRTAGLLANSLVGSASGSLKKRGAPAANSGKKEKKNGRPVKKEHAEVYVGGD